MRNLRRMEPEEIARFTGFFEADHSIVFCLNPRRYPHVDFDRNPVHVAGPFNDWGRSDDMDAFVLRPHGTRSGKPLYSVAVDRDRVVAVGKRMTFKFVTADWHWLTPLRCAPNVIEDKTGNLNYVLNSARTGMHAYVFETGSQRGLDRVARIEWKPPRSNEPRRGHLKVARGSGSGANRMSP